MFDLNTGDLLPPPLLGSFYAFDPNFTGGVSVGTDYLTGDVSGDKVPDIVVGTGAGTGSLVRVFDGKSGKQVREFSPFGSGMTAGVTVATAFVDDDRADIVVGPVPPRVRIPPPPLVECGQQTRGHFPTVSASTTLMRPSPSRSRSHRTTSAPLSARSPVLGVWSQPRGYRPGRRWNSPARATR